MTFLYLSSDRMGSGDDALGRKLLEAFLEKLVASDAKVALKGASRIVKDGFV